MRHDAQAAGGALGGAEAAREDGAIGFVVVHDEHGAGERGARGSGRVDDHRVVAVRTRNDRGNGARRGGGGIRGDGGRAGELLEFGEARGLVVEHFGEQHRRDFREANGGAADAREVFGEGLSIE